MSCFWEPRLGAIDGARARRCGPSPSDAKYSSTRSAYARRGLGEEAALKAARARRRGPYPERGLDETAVLMDHVAHLARRWS
jgi:hypothetical protein